VIKVASSLANSRPRHQKGPGAHLQAHSSFAPTRAPLHSSHPMGDVTSTVDLPSVCFVWSQLFSSDLLLVETALIVVLFAGDVH
jgi:hypothetical protein